jgi:hypothetical protein
MERRKTVWRALAVLAGLAVVAGAISPSFGAATLTKKKVKRIAKKQVQALGSELFLEEGGEFFRYSVRMNAGDADRTVGTFGPFTLSAHCEEDAGDNVSEILITTSEAGSIFDSYENTEAPFDPSDGAIVFIEASDPGSDPYDKSYDLVGHAASPSGTFIQAFAPTYTDVGIDCSMAGYVSISNA